jgi:hypothetical protein
VRSRRLLLLLLPAAALDHQPACGVRLAVVVVASILLPACSVRPASGRRVVVWRDVLVVVWVRCCCCCCCMRTRRRASVLPLPLLLPLPPLLRRDCRRRELMQCLCWLQTVPMPPVMLVQLWMHVPIVCDERRRRVCGEGRRGR